MPGFKTGLLRMKMAKILLVTLIFSFLTACSEQSASKVQNNDEYQKNLQGYHACLLSKADKYEFGTTDVRYLVGVIIAACQAEFKAEHNQRLIIDNDDWARESDQVELKILGDRHNFFKEHANVKF